MIKTIFSLTVMAFTTSSFADTFIVTANSTSWSPSEANVVPGDVIRFEYGSGYPHTITSGSSCTYDGLYFNAELNSPGDYYEFTITEDLPSEIPFFCDPHCKMGMTGVIYIDNPATQGNLEVGIVDISNCGYNYSLIKGTSNMWVSGFTASSFVFGVEIGTVDELVEVTALTEGNATLSLYDPQTETSSPLVTGTYTLESGKRYMFQGNSTFSGDHFDFNLSWAEGSDNKEVLTIKSISGGGGTLSSIGDTIVMRSVQYGNSTMFLSVNKEVEVPMTVIANVECDTLTLPESGVETNVILPVGDHLIWVNRWGEELGMLSIQFGDGGDGNGIPADVNGDCVVDVTDLLEIISAWGTTCP